MRVSKIQSTYVKSQNQLGNVRTQRIMNEPTQPTVTAPTFKGDGNGALAGLGTGLVTGLAAVGGLAISGTLLLPALIGSAIVLGVGAAGAYVGNKIEDKIKENKD